ncbi:MAG TPA: YvrJ family protein, partial [Syntrophomonas wolfei]|nr:YvrJ family protein [Syntrophomonas wolfei]
MDEMLKIIGNVGFPIAVAAFLLVRVEQRMDSLTAAIGELREAILM